MRTLEVVLFTAALGVAGLVLLALAWSTDGPYRQLATANAADRITFLSHGPGGDVDVPMTIEALVAAHHAWASYVTGAGDPPDRTFGRSIWTDDEYAHMADVRGVFDGAKVLVPASLLVIIIRLQRARARGARDMWSLVRTSSIAAAALVILIGLVAVFAFEPLFLLFHQVFFPQGNFLFDPARSNLVRLYPDWYWEGITVRVGASFVVLMLALAAVAHLRVVRGLA